MAAQVCPVCETPIVYGDAVSWKVRDVIHAACANRAFAVDEIALGEPLTVEDVRTLESVLPKPETAAEAWMRDRVRHLILTLRHEQERHRETRDEWVSACERADGAFAEVTELRCEAERLRADRALLARAIWSCPEVHDGSPSDGAEALVTTVLGGSK